MSRLQRFKEAERWYQAALQAEPDHVPAHITYGKLLAKNVCIYHEFYSSNSDCFAARNIFNKTSLLQSSRIAEAEIWFRRAQKLAPSDPGVYHHFGEFLVQFVHFNVMMVNFEVADRITAIVKSFMNFVHT